MERLSALDAEFLLVEDGIAHMHIAGMSVFDGPPPALEELTAMVAAKLHLIPRYRQRVRSMPLDRERPLWELWFVEGLEDGRWALVSKVHHCMVDGVSGVDLLSVLVDAEPDVPLPEPGRGLVEFAKYLGRTTPRTLEGSIGPHRAWAHASIDITDVRAVRQEIDATVNDVVLAVLAGAFRDLLLHRGENPDATVLRTLVPVSVRPLDARGVPDNQVSAILFELPVHVADPAERVRLVHEQMKERKASHMSEAGEVVLRLGNLAPPMVVVP